MINTKTVISVCKREKLELFQKDVELLIKERMKKKSHGNIQDWYEAINLLPKKNQLPANLKTSVINIPKLKLNHQEKASANKCLLNLIPWRKGPFDIDGIFIDSEWKSNVKWDRIKKVLGSLEGKKILDVGCANGYYSLRMRGEGARLVIGIDPIPLNIFQFKAITHFMLPEPVYILPLRLSELRQNIRAFDVVFSMGVLYHQRSPFDHLRQLKNTLKTGGQLILETLILTDKHSYSKTPNDRYARMRNIWFIPTITELKIWLEKSGFHDISVLDINRTSTEEQRSTKWMPFESLKEGLNPKNPKKTIEGWPSPTRIIIMCKTSRS